MMQTSPPVTISPVRCSWQWLFKIGVIAVFRPMLPHTMAIGLALCKVICQESWLKSLEPSINPCEFLAAQVSSIVPTELVNASDLISKPAMWHQARSQCPLIYSLATSTCACHVASSFAKLYVLELDALLFLRVVRQVLVWLKLCHGFLLF